MPRPKDAAIGIPAEPSIGDHGLIGDMRTAALIDRWGRINWLCWPRFDSDPVFRRLVDPHDGGCWQLAPDVPFSSSRRYLPDTNVLETTFSCAEGTAVATDFMAIPTEERPGSQLIRIVEGKSGAVPFRMSLRASQGFEQGTSILHLDDGAVLIGDRPQPIALTATEPIKVIAGTATVEKVLRPGQVLVFVLSEERLTHSLTGHSLKSRDATARWFWNWIGRCELPKFKRDTAARSALVLKMLHYQPTSTLVAAPTTSLPEHIGGSRNWDYRYSWLRDSSMMVLALQRLGHHDEAMGFWDSLARIAAENGDDLSIAYTIDGGAVPEERTIVNLPGYRRSRPVRVGNGAAGQRQHDAYGHILAAAAHCYHHMDMETAAPQPVLRSIADLAARRWNRPDDSIWEVRDGRDHHTYSYLMSWLALDQAVDLADHGALEGDAGNWAAQRDASRREILNRAWNPAVGSFTATLGGEDLDASALVAPLIGFLPAQDPRCRATRRTIIDHLSENGLLRRYRTDDVSGDSEGAFLLCTLWLADNFTLDGDPAQGEELLDRVLSTGNDLGLLAEEANPETDEPLGNFPQGLTHLGVIQSITRLDSQ